MKKLGLKIDELTAPEMEHILTRAEERVRNAILFVFHWRKTQVTLFF
jgi:hypothetical protein